MTKARRFTFRLALALGECNPDAMLARMPFRILQEWIVYAGYEPFGYERIDNAIGILASVVANRHRTEGERRYKPKDFIPEYGPAERKSPDQLFKQLIAMNKAMGGEFIDKRKSNG